MFALRNLNTFEIYFLFPGKGKFVSFGRENKRAREIRVFCLIWLDLTCWLGDRVAIWSFPTLTEIFALRFDGDLDVEENLRE